MKVVSFIEDEQLVKKILKHLNLWDVKRKPPPRANGLPAESFTICDESSSPSADDPETIRGALEKTDWNISKAARLLGISRWTMYRRFEKYNINRPGDNL